MDREEKLVDILVNDEADGQRLDICLAKTFPKISRSKIQKSIKSGKIIVNGAACKPNTVLAKGHHVLGSLESEQKALQPQPIDLNIVYEDQGLIVLNKPAGISVHPGAGPKETTLVEGLLAYCGRLSEAFTDSERPGIVHRIDKGTSGLIVCAKTDPAFVGLAKQFAEKTNTREYHALLDGLLPCSKLVFESYLHRDPKNRLRFASVEKQPGNTPQGKYAKSQFTQEAVFGHRLSLVRVKLFTGRTHQIRVHSSHLGAPILGDQLYNRKAELPTVFSSEVKRIVSSLSRQMLHAYKLGFVHPVKGEYMEFIADFPEDFGSLLGSLGPYKVDTC
ncbi:MAG: RluA family pseudouridine synthase [Oligoflexales bacterium]|nr:RluA family pseudouridine synthase [Oligoflexales bacterium]